MFEMETFKPFNGNFELFLIFRKAPIKNILTKLQTPARPQERKNPLAKKRKKNNFSIQKS
jgi:hypothetical protein